MPEVPVPIFKRFLLKHHWLITPRCGAEHATRRFSVLPFKQNKQETSKNNTRICENMRMTKIFYQ